MMKRGLFLMMILSAALLAPSAHAQSRNAAFLDPASSSGGSSGGKSGPSVNTVVADPAQTDAGETLVNVARRVTVFFYNGFRAGLPLNELTMNADGNVRSKVLTDDCRALKTLPAQARCSVVLEIVPSSPGPWSVELLLNHAGQGRIARAEVVGSTLGKTDEKSEGLAVSKKISAPIDFGTVHADSESAARTMLIENDSTEPLKIDSVDLIEGGGDLRLREAGCQKGDELKPGESCPITVLWEPRSGGNIATDLIVHHSGSLGFVVVPIRGASSGDKDDGGSKSASNGKKDKTGGLDIPTLVPRNSTDRGAIPLPPQPPSMDEIARSLPTIDGSRLTPPPVKQVKKSRPAVEKTAQNSDGSDVPEPPKVSLIGSVNGRAILGDADGMTYMVSLGETTTINDTAVVLLQLDTNRAVVNVAGARKELKLRQAPTFMKTEKAAGFEVGGGSGGSSGMPAPLPSSSTSSPLAPATGSNSALSKSDMGLEPTGPGFAPGGGMGVNAAPTPNGPIGPNGQPLQGVNSSSVAPPGPGIGGSGVGIGG